MNKFLIKTFFELNCIQFGSFKLKNGTTSPFYINLRILISKPEILKKIAELVYNSFIKQIHLECIQNNEILSICGLPYAGIPLANYISCLYNIPLLLLRKEKKEYGTKQMIEGITDKTNKIIILDDIITSGTSINESLPYFVNFKIEKIIAIIDREQPKKIDLKYESFFKIKEIFYFLKLANLINKQDYDNSLKFLDN